MSARPPKSGQAKDLPNYGSFQHIHVNSKTQPLSVPPPTNIKADPNLWPDVWLEVIYKDATRGLKFKDKDGKNVIFEIDGKKIIMGFNPFGNRNQKLEGEALENYLLESGLEPTAANKAAIYDPNQYLLASNITEEQFLRCIVEYTTGKKLPKTKTPEELASLNATELKKYQEEKALLEELKIILGRREGLDETYWVVPKKDKSVVRILKLNQFPNLKKFIKENPKAWYVMTQFHQGMGSTSTSYLMNSFILESGDKQKRMFPALPEAVMFMKKDAQGDISFNLNHDLKKLTFQDSESGITQIISKRDFGLRVDEGEELGDTLMKINVNISIKDNPDGSLGTEENISIALQEQGQEKIVHTNDIAELYTGIWDRTLKNMREIFEFQKIPLKERGFILQELHGPLRSIERCESRVMEEFAKGLAQMKFAENIFDPQSAERNKNMALTIAKIQNPGASIQDKLQAIENLHQDIKAAHEVNAGLLKNPNQDSIEEVRALCVELDFPGNFFDWITGERKRKDDMLQAIGILKDTQKSEQERLQAMSNVNEILYQPKSLLGSLIAWSSPLDIHTLFKEVNKISPIPVKIGGPDSSSGTVGAIERKTEAELKKQWTHLGKEAAAIAAAKHREVLAAKAAQASQSSMPPMIHSKSTGDPSAKAFTREEEQKEKLDQDMQGPSSGKNKR